MVDLEPSVPLSTSSKLGRGSWILSIVSPDLLPTFVRLSELWEAAFIDIL